MKHLHLFENHSSSSIRNAISIYKKFLVDMKSVVFEKYNQIAEEYDNDEDGELEYPETGDKPQGTANNDYFYISDIVDFNNGFEFILVETDRNGEIEATYYIPFTDEEINDAFIDLDAKKYNI